MKIYFKNTPKIDFWAGVKSGVKTHTCRKRKVAEGANIDLVCGGETIPAKVISVRPVVIEIAPYGPVISVSGGLLTPEGVDLFCKHGGFPNTAAMFDYYGDDFRGFIIKFAEGGF
jgi:hypothetical protein